MEVWTFITLLFSNLFLSLVLSAPDEIKLWCGQTPNPIPCVYYMGNDAKYNLPINQKSDFLKLSLQLALDQTIHAKSDMNQLGSKCRNDYDKAAWSDCIELYESTVDRINKTLNPYINYSQVDKQTWLSAALTNIDTCRICYIELGLDNIIFLSMSNNVSMLISNALALNNDPSFEQNSSISYNYNFPNKALVKTKANVVVARDGSGNYKTINEAISAVPEKYSGRYVIYVKEGTYKENVQIKLKNIKLVGDGIGRTIITGSKSVGGGSTTFNSATVAVTGDNFIAQGITFKNTAGPSNHQAVALRSGSDLSVFYKCSFEGYQDTLYVHSDRQFYRECDIYGTVDSIFGNAAVVLQNCNIYLRKPPNKTNTITAQGRSDPNQNTGISIHNCKVTAAQDLKNSQDSVKTYLGRPWKEYSRTVFMKTYLDSLIDPEGWLAWSGDFALTTLYYGEYRNTGPGSSTSNRVKWAGYHVITSSSEASKFTVANFIDGDSWLPETGVPYTSGL